MVRNYGVIAIRIDPKGSILIPGKKKIYEYINISTFGSSNVNKIPI